LGKVGGGDIFGTEGIFVAVAPAQGCANSFNRAKQAGPENIVPVHATGCERGVHYYAMQFIDGLTPWPS
jgi:hypothetical protein